MTYCTFSNPVFNDNLFNEVGNKASTSTVGEIYDILMRCSKQRNNNILEIFYEHLI